jgi:hypothetical protein
MLGATTVPPNVTITNGITEELNGSSKQKATKDKFVLGGYEL